MFSIRFVIWSLTKCEHERKVLQNTLYTVIPLTYMAGFHWTKQVAQKAKVLTVLETTSEESEHKGELKEEIPAST